MEEQVLHYELSSDLDVPGLAREFAQNGVVQVPGIFPAAMAEGLTQVLYQQTPWKTALSDDAGKPVLYSPEELKQMSQQQVTAMTNALYQRARDQFAFAYRSYPMVDEAVAGHNPGHPLHTLLEFMNTVEVLSVLKQITGAEDVVKMDGHATLYLPGNFLSNHDDTGLADRRVAYTLGFSKDWNPDWGGLTLFYDENDPQKIIRSLVPGWNVLTLFKVPCPHSVSYVSPFAKMGRFSITGWLRAG